MARNLSGRINSLTDELHRLSDDKKKNIVRIRDKENELHAAQNELDLLKEQLGEAQEIADEFLCPYCKSRMVEHTYSDEDYHGIDINHELIVYECGHTIIDGKVESQCKPISNAHDTNNQVKTRIIE